MSTGGKVLVGVVVVAGAAVGGYFLVRAFQQEKSVVDEAVATVQGTLDGLDPVARAAAVAKLASDEAKSLKTTLK